MDVCELEFPNERIDRSFLLRHPHAWSGQTLTRPSAGVLLYRNTAAATPELLIVHMGGPFWRRRDEGGWSIPKGELEDGEEALPAALREFEEELGSPLPPIELIPLGEIRQTSGKRVIAFAGEGDFDAEDIRSNTFTMEWPRGSGRQREFPEIDRAAWVSCDEARVKLVRSQVEFVDRLLDLLSRGG
jgi:predicted NUDIX family NTP pyrophosphohydrolase